MKMVLFYEGKWYMFSNFSAFAIYWRGEDWMTTEHAYQAAKFTDETIQKQIRDVRSPHDAKVIARRNFEHVRKDWSLVKLEIMEEIIRTKHAQHEVVRDALVESGDLFMIENSHKDSFWGRGPDWKGENHLGRIWMKIRSELHSNLSA